MALEMVYKSNVPLHRSSFAQIPSRVLSYKVHGQWVGLSIVHKQQSSKPSPKSNKSTWRSTRPCPATAAILNYDPKMDSWTPLDTPRALRYPENAAEMVVDSDRGLLYMLDQAIVFSIERKKWTSHSLLPPRWTSEESTTLYIGGNEREFHGLYHDNKDYGLCHVIISADDGDDWGNLSEHCRIDKELRFSGLQFVHCDWLQQLTVFGGKQKERERMEGKEGRVMRRKLIPSSLEIQEWSENLFSYKCNIGHHQRERPSLRSWGRSQFQWTKSENEVGGLYHPQMRSVVAFGHIAIVFKYFGKDEYITMICWDLIWNRWESSPFVLDFECGHFDDLQVVNMGHGIIHVFDRRGRHHVEVNAFEILGADFRAKTAVRYEALVEKWCQSGDLGDHNLKLIQNYLFSLAGSFPCECDGCVSSGP